MSRRFQPNSPVNSNGGIQLLPDQGQGPMFNVGPLMNDIQLVALTAAGLLSDGYAKGNADTAVDLAIDIVARSLILVNSGVLTKRVQELAAEAAKPKLEG